MLLTCQSWMSPFALPGAPIRCRPGARLLMTELASESPGELAVAAPRPIGAAGRFADADFAAFYRAHRARTVAVVSSLTGDRAAAEDIVQEAFATALRRWSTIRRYDRPGDWVKRVALNRAISRFHRGRREETALRRIAGERDRPPREHDRDDPVWVAVRALPRRQAQVMALLFIDDLTIEQASETLDISAGSVKTHLHRARQTLAAALGPAAPDDESAR